MYHGRFSGTHYEAGFQWGTLLRKNGKKLDHCPTFALEQKRYDFAKECVLVYQEYFPAVLEEIRGIAEGNGVPVETLQALLFSMYCFEFQNKCTCFAFSTKDEIVFARNSDFLVSLEKLYMNCLYNLQGSYRFNGNTTAFVQMEDGVNQHGLAVGLTFVYPRLRKPGLNAGMLVRWLLEECKTTGEALAALHRVPIASAQTLTIADANGTIAVVECNPEKIVVISPRAGEQFVATANNFNSPEMQAYRNPDIDDWRSGDRYQTAQTALSQQGGNLTVAFAQALLSGKYGFMCQYDRKQNADTVWSVVYDLKRNQIWRVEGNPSRAAFKEDLRMKFDEGVKQRATQARKGRLDMDFQIEQLPVQNTVYMRRTGAYGMENFKLMAALKEWAAEKSLLEGGTIYGIAQDGLETPPENCRYDVCLVVTAEVPADAAVQRGEIPGGTYAVFTVSHTAEAVQAFWESVWQRLQENGLQLDPAKPILERYRYDLVQAGKSEFCVPVMK